MTEHAAALRQPPLRRVPVTVETIPCRQDPARQPFPRVIAGGAQIVDEPKRLLDGSFNFTLLVRPGLRSIAVNTNACRGFKNFVVLDSTVRHIDVPMMAYAGGHARQAPVLKRDPSLVTGSVAGLLPIPNLTAQLDDGHGKIYTAESDGLAYYIDLVPPGKYFLSISGEGYKGRFALEVSAYTLTRHDVPMTDLTPGS